MTPHNSLLCHSSSHPKHFWPRYSQNLVGCPVKNNICKDTQILKTSWKFCITTIIFKPFHFVKCLSHLLKNNFICFNDSPLKVMKNDFYFILKALLVLKIFKFLSWLFGHVEKRLPQKNFERFLISSHWRCSVKKDIFKNLANFTRKHLSWSLILIRLQTSKHVILQNICDRLLLCVLPLLPLCVTICSFLGSLLVFEL